MIKGVKTSMLGKRKPKRFPMSPLVGPQTDAFRKMKMKKYSAGPITMPGFMWKKGDVKKGSAWKGGRKVR